MSVVRPMIDGIDPARADAFVRWRILAWRGQCRGAGASARLSLVRIADVNASTYVADDVAWWDAPVRAATGSDHGTRADVLHRLLHDDDGAPLVGVWARPGPNDIMQSDLGWSAALRACPATGPVDLLVITRWGWISLPDGSSRTWTRLRTAP